MRGVRPTRDQPMPSAIDIEALAQEMKAAQDLVQQIEPFSNRFQGFDLNSAYRIASRIHQARIAEGANPIGRKIGFTNPEMWAIYGVHEPIWAYVYDKTVVQLESLQTKCSINEFTEPKIEPEIIFHLCSDLPENADTADVVNAIDWVAHGFEIVQSHFPDWRFQAPDTVADCALHGTLIIGPSIPLEKLGGDPVDALESISVNLLCEDKLVETGVGSNVLGNPFAAVVHLTSVLGKQFDHAPLKAGELVSTGTITTARSVSAGEIWRSEIRGAKLAGLKVEFVH